MYTVTADNVDDALFKGIRLLKQEGILAHSRNGQVLRMPRPVTTIFTDPVGGRVIFNPVRDANPVFHLMEAIWMLAGDDRVEWLLQFNSSFGQFAEKSGRMWGAYGWRWRNCFDVDQINAAVKMLRENPATRQCVIQMWDANRDLDINRKDIPCNTHIYFDCIGGRLNMTVCNRSNDVVWGAYGSNAVHFSMLHELIALSAGLGVGNYYQMSNNYHVYSERPDVIKLFDANALPSCRPEDLEAVPMLHPGEPLSGFLHDCDYLSCRPVGELVPSPVHFRTEFFMEVAGPLYNDFIQRKKGLAFNDYKDSTVDWHAAFHQWVSRRNQRKEQA